MALILGLIQKFILHPLKFSNLEDRLQGSGPEGGPKSFVTNIEIFEFNETFSLRIDKNLEIFSESVFLRPFEHMSELKGEAQNV